MDEVDFAEYEQAKKDSEHLCQCWKCKNNRKWRREEMADLTIPQVFDVIRQHSKFCSVCGKPLDLGKLEWHLPFCTECRLKVIDEAAKAVSANFEVAQNVKKVPREIVGLKEAKKEIAEEKKKKDDKYDDGW
jgi:hypothetical protein